MRNLFAALLLLASAPLTRQKMIEDVVRFSRAEEIEHAAIAAVIDALADNATAEEKKTLQELRARALGHETGDLWAASFDQAFDDAALAKLHEFYVSPAANRLTGMQAGLLEEHMRERLSKEPPARQRDRRMAMRTMADMRALATAIEARATDTNEYPDTTDMESLRKLVEPTYIKHMPEKDAWGHPFVYVGTPDRQQYRIVSAGADGTFEHRAIPMPQSAVAKVEVRLTDRYEDDIIFENGQFVQVPRDIAERDRD
jgi:hypothetical protein